MWCAARLYHEMKRANAADYTYKSYGKVEMFIFYK